jgi:nitrogen fixation/metabolism regulation signal transduction histidine kinase
MDIIENSIAGGASQITVKLDKVAHGTLRVTICDNGTGMKELERERAMDPFFTTKKGKRFGLGLALFKQSAEETAGWFEIESDERTGTTIRAVFHTDHADMKPLGDIEGTVTLLEAYHPEIDFRLEGAGYETET